MFPSKAWRSSKTSSKELSCPNAAEATEPRKVPKSTENSSSSKVKLVKSGLSMVSLWMGGRGGNGITSERRDEGSQRRIYCQANRSRTHMGETTTSPTLRSTMISVDSGTETIGTSGSEDAVEMLCAEEKNDDVDSSSTLNENEESLTLMF